MKSNGKPHTEPSDGKHSSLEHSPYHPPYLPSPDIKSPDRCACMGTESNSRQFIFKFHKPPVAYRPVCGPCLAHEACHRTELNDDKHIILFGVRDRFAKIPHRCPEHLDALVPLAGPWPYCLAG